MASAIEQDTNGANGASNATALAPFVNTPSTQTETDSGAIAPYASTRNFESAQRAARALSSSTLVPKDYQGNIANCLLAMELASRIRYEIVGTDPFAKDYRVRAAAMDKASGDMLEGEWITWTMVMGEKWNEKPGSKWKTMPGQMFRYRAAAFWTRVYAPEISLGMHTAEEYEDIAAYRPEPSGGARDLNAALRTIEPAVAALPAASEQADDRDDLGL
jgi:hypothetical protein